MDAGLRSALEPRQQSGLVLGACGNSMKGFNISLEQLPSGARALPQGGVVRIMELQERGRHGERDRSGSAIREGRP